MKYLRFDSFRYVQMHIEDWKKIEDRNKMKHTNKLEFFEAFSFPLFLNLAQRQVSTGSMILPFQSSTTCANHCQDAESPKARIETPASLTEVGKLQIQQTAFTICWHLDTIWILFGPWW